MKPIFSIIIPVFNNDRFIQATINSIINQSFKDFEIIIIDDGSRDKSAFICKKMAKRDRRIKVICIENQGVGYARNKGLNFATGEWIYFLDSDDLMEKGTLNYIYQKIHKNNNYSMILGSFKYVYDNYEHLAQNTPQKVKGITGAFYYGKWNIKICMGSFFVKRDILVHKSIFFDDKTKYGEDVEVINYCLLNSQSVLVLDKCILSYIIHNNSSISRVDLNRYDCYKARKRTLDYIKKNFSNESELIDLYEDFLLPEAIIETTKLLCRNGINIFKIKSFIKKNKLFEELYKKRNSPSLPFNMKKDINIFLFSPLIFFVIHRGKHIYYYMREFLGKIKRRF